MENVVQGSRVMDGFTTNGVFIYHPEEEFMNNNLAKFKYSVWSEVSSLGFIYYHIGSPERKEIPRKDRKIVKKKV